MGANFLMSEYFNQIIYGVKSFLTGMKLTLNHFNKCPLVSKNCKRMLYITVSRVTGKFFLKEMKFISFKKLVNYE